MAMQIFYCSLIGASLISAGACAVTEPVDAGDPGVAPAPDSVRYQLIASGSSLAKIDFDDDCVVTLRDIAIGIYLELQAKDLAGVDSDGDGVLSANDTIEQIGQILAASVSDPDKSGATDEADVAKVLVDVSSSSQDAGSDVTQDATLDGGDVGEIGGQLGRTNVMNYAKAQSVIYAYMGRVAPSIESGLFGWHTAQTEADCGGFGGGNWPDDDTHYELTSQNYPPYHAEAVSRVFPGNHMVSTSGSWPAPVCESGIVRDSCEWPGDVEHWPPNHNVTVSESWNDAPDGHSEVHSFQWRNRPDHFYETSATWGPDHEMEISRMWPSGHTKHYSDLNSGNLPESHHDMLSGTWDRAPIHSDELSALWPPNHRKYVSSTWGMSHNGLYSMLWPATHVGSVSEGWPTGVPPRSWPPNHNGPVSSRDSNALPPMPMELLPPDHTYFTTANGLFQLPFPDMPWPPARSGGTGPGIGDY